MFIIYDVIFILFAILYFPYLIIRGKWHDGFKMRFGRFPSSLVKKFERNDCIWIHAVSVGEVLAIEDLIQKVKERCPQYKIVCSTVTTTGYQIAQEKLRSDCVIIYAPLDFSWIVKKFIAVIKPKIYISAETEIWPNLYTALHKRGVPIIQINGRISDQSFKRYKRVRFLTKRVLSCVDLFYMQSSTDAKRIQRLGAESEKVHVAGNIKFDNIPVMIEMRKEDLGFQANVDLLIAGSTHPGEEDILIEMYERLVEQFNSLRLVIVPRHAERSDDIVQLIEKKGYKAIRFSQIHEYKDHDKAIVVVDAIGHLRALYSLAKIVFVGKSFTVGGGQNMIEPASFGKPTIVGPLTQNFKDVVKNFLDANAIIQVNNVEDLYLRMRDLLAHPKMAKDVGEAAQQTVMKHQGATSKTVDAIAALLNR